MDSELLRALGWVLIVVGIIYQLAGWFYLGVTFEPWALLFIAAGLTALAGAKVAGARGDG